MFLNAVGERLLLYLKNLISALSLSNEHFSAISLRFIVVVSSRFLIRALRSLSIKPLSPSPEFLIKILDK